MGMIEDNPEGSLTEMEKCIVEDCLLGDATMRRKTNSLIEINHSFKQKALVDHLYFVLRRFVISKPKRRNGNGSRVAYRFTTRSLPVFNDFYDRFFRNGIKVVPQDLVLMPVHLAYWLMDDGNRLYNSVYFNTQQFGLGDQKNLLNKLSVLQVSGRLNKDKNYHRIRVLTSNAPRLKQMVYPYVLPEFRYKLL